ncbi:hypothetical protein [Novosphingobium sp. ST904]|nr:hypothetical protein [Novosphingobium sp. ST904]TCM43333.1 hypothetical protein EDF59_101437 [Novosphingobium sp. ST904]
MERLPAIAACLMAATLSTSCTTPNPGAKGGGKNYLETVSTADELMARLAMRAATKFNGDRPGSPDFQVIVTGNAYPIGTLIRRGTSIPVDYNACQIAEPPKVSSPNIFPDYLLMQKTGFNFGLDSNAVAKVASAGVDFSNTDNSTLTFSGTQTGFLSDNDLKRLMSSKECRDAISSTDAWLVRGYIEGKRTFELKKESNKEVKIGFNKIGSFDLNFGSGNASLSFTDEEPTQFLQVVSQLTIDQSGTIQSAIPSPGPSASQAGKIYIQRDKADTSGNGTAVRAALGALPSQVAQGIEAIDSQKMPTLAQVRYFNVADEGLAQQALTILKLTYSNAIMKRVPLPSPSGQLEIWLPRVGQ